MTGETKNPSTDDQLRARFEHAAPAIHVDPAPVVRRARRRRAVTRAATGLVVTAAVLTVALVTRPWGDGSAPVATAAPPPEPRGAVSVEISPRVVEPGDAVTAVLVAHEANDLTFGVAARVERWDGSRWRPSGVAHLCLAEWECVGSVGPRLGATEDIGLGAEPGTLGPATTFSTEGLGDGWYRLVQSAVLDEDVATGAFEIRAGAGAAPPLPPRDEVALTVTPVLVPPDGGQVSVATWVPAGADGTLTSEDVEAADRQLGATALVQRWTTQQWRDAIEVRVGRRDAGLGVEWGSPVVLPALEEGSYRVVRTRDDGSQAWGTFAVTAAAPVLEEPDAEGEPGPGSEADGATSGPACDLNPGRCLLAAWWTDLTTGAGLTSGGGDHDVGTLLSDSVDLGDDTYLWTSLFPVTEAPDGDASLTVTSTTQVGEATVEAGQWDHGAAGRRLTCGGLVLQAGWTDLEDDRADEAIGRLARAMTDCPADLDELAARYPEVPPTG
ncbi:hypothetical protein GXB85_05520 [Cellulomonas sp. APG4]|uniref:hypothetical protein n=1 Tax=Cellulomonas sp. APG4 TaxID=1538656 RepID=UPI001379CEE2|nr:hypothetical protein [Cellulomonas sp. APG4]NCT90410.1 hypothetical protein [Cellulomonas sp. APG4]